MLDLLQSRPVQIVKIGGSLLDLPDLADRLEHFFDRYIIEHPLILVGGGPVADSIRQLDMTFQLDARLTHELGVQTLELTARVLVELSSCMQLVESPSECLAAWKSSRLPVLHSVSMLLDHSPLPASWDVTSDSIAAWLSTLHPDSRLILLKSTDLEGVTSLQMAADAGLVDRFFPEIAGQVSSIQWVNLRRQNSELICWQQHATCRWDSAQAIPNSASEDSEERDG